MLGHYAQHSHAYLATLMIVTTLSFALPIFLVPLAWARLVRWKVPAETHLAIYFGRCLGAFILVVELLMLRALLTGAGLRWTFDTLFLVFGLMLVVHVWGAIRRIQPITETLEIGLWALLLVLNAVFYPAATITP